MKKSYLLLTAAFAMAAMLFTSCDKDDSEDTGISLNDTRWAPAAPGEKPGETFTFKWTCSDPTILINSLVEEAVIKNENLIQEKYSLEDLLYSAVKSVNFYGTGDMTATYRTPFEEGPYSEAPKGYVSFKSAGNNEIRIYLNLNQILDIVTANLTGQTKETDPMVMSLVTKIIQSGLMTSLGEGFKATYIADGDKLDLTIDFTQFINSLEPLASSIIGDEEFMTLLSGKLADSQAGDMMDRLKPILDTIPTCLKSTNCFQITFHLNRI